MAHFWWNAWQIRGHRRTHTAGCRPPTLAPPGWSATWRALGRISHALAFWPSAGGSPPRWARFPGLETAPAVLPVAPPPIGQSSGNVCVCVRVCACVCARVRDFDLRAHVCRGLSVHQSWWQLSRNSAASWLCYYCHGTWEALLSWDMEARNATAWNRTSILIE